MKRDHYPWRDVLDRAFDCVACEALTYYAGPTHGWEHSTGEARRAMAAAFADASDAGGL